MEGSGRGMEEGRTEEGWKKGGRRWKKDGRGSNHVPHILS